MESVTITLPNRPVITVHKGWAPSKNHGNTIKSIPAVDQPCFETHTFSILSRKGKSAAASLPKEETSLVRQIILKKPLETGQRFNFINDASEPLHTRDAAIRKLVRSHAMKEVARERREQTKKKMKLSDKDTKRENAGVPGKGSLSSERPIEYFSADGVETVPPAQDQSDPGASVNYCFANYQSKSQDLMRRLATLYFTQIGSAIFPVEFHLAYNPPMVLSKLDFSFLGDAVFQSLRYAASVCSTLADGRRNSSDITMQMDTTIRLVNRLLEGGTGVPDGLLGAVSHLAMGEALRGNFNDWSVHMTGLKRMVEMRGGMNRIHTYLQMKLYRADVMGSIDLMSCPFFCFDGSHRPAIYSNPYPPADNALLASCTAHVRLAALLPRLAIVLTEIREFSRMIEQKLLTPEATLDPKELIEAWFSIQYQLLSRAPIEDVSDGRHTNFNDELEEAFRLGAIIYMKEILKEFTFSATGYKLLVSRLQYSLSLIRRFQFTPELSSLLLWLFVMGGVASVNSIMDRTLFVTYLVSLRSEIGVNEWKDVKEQLENVLWIGEVLDKPGKVLWEEVRLASGDIFYDSAGGIGPSLLQVGFFD